nr:unnamed protein product [Callosobruchus chinensis]
MASVQAPDNQSTVLATLPSGLLFDTFKSSPEDDKDSDEESFHLPMLDCDEDLQLDKTSNATESEEDILNKFETSPSQQRHEDAADNSGELENETEEKSKEIPTENNDDVNDKETIANEDDADKNQQNEAVPVKDGENKDAGESAFEISDGKTTNEKDVESEVKTQNEELNEAAVSHCLEKKIGSNEIANEDAINEDNVPTKSDGHEKHDKLKEEEQLESLLSQSESASQTYSNENSNVDDEEGSLKDLVDKINVKMDDSNDELDLNDDALSGVSKSKMSERVQDKGKDCKDAEAKEKVSEDMKEGEAMDTEGNNEIVEAGVKEHTEEPMLVDDDEENKDSEKVVQNDLSGPEAKSDGAVNASQAGIEKDTQTQLSPDSLADKTPEIEQGADSCMTVDQDEMIEGGEDTQKDEKENKEDSKREEESLVADIDQRTELPKEPLAEELSKNEQEMDLNKEGSEYEEKNSTDEDKTEDASKESKVANKSDTNSTKKETTEAASGEDKPPKTGSDAEQKEEEPSENLLDISVIRDVDEDNATAIAEEAADSQSSEKSDNDELDQEDDKTDEVEDSSEPDHEADKDETMDFEEEEETTNVLLSAKPSDESKKQTGSDVDTTLTPEADKVDVQPNVAPVTSTVSDTITPSAQESAKDIPSQKKRSLSPVQQNETPSKKICLSKEKVLKEESTPKTEEVKESAASDKVKVLLTFQKFMQNKKIKDKLTRSDLEQLCIQKICEAIVHKTDVGELHQTVKRQEQVIENLRKDLVTLAKQARDLDVVNKKLMNELKQQHGKKPLVPLKITRSVGLQVKINMSVEPTRRKSTSTSSTSSSPAKAASSPVVNRSRNVQTNAAGSSVLRTVAQTQSPVRSPASQTTATTPILSKALTSAQQATQQRSSPLVVHSTPASPLKRAPIRKSPGMAEPHKVMINSQLKQTPNKPIKPSQPGVIDLTDEDDRVATPKTGGPSKVVRGVAMVQQTKANGGTPPKGAVQPKNVVKVGQQGTPPGRTVAGLSPGVRLTPNQIKNGIAIPVSTGSTTQVMYVVPTSTANSNPKTVQQLATMKHPAPLPLPPVMSTNLSFKPVLPKPHLTIRKTDNGIILQWRMPYNLDLYETIASYQLFAYQESDVGDVKALALPMACTLTQFADKNKYYFAVRSVDVHNRIGAFSDPEEISL